MGQEVTTNVTVDLVHADYSFNAVLSRVSDIVADSNPSFTRKFQSVTTASSQTVDFGDISGTPSLVILINHDDTNFVVVSDDTDTAGTNPLPKLWPKVSGSGGVNIAMFSPESATVHIKANTATCLVEVIAIKAHT